MDTAITTAPLKRSTLLLGVYASGDLAVVVIVGALAFLLVLLALNAMGTAGMPSLAWYGLLEQSCLLLALLGWERWRPLPAPVAPLRTPWPQRRAWLIGALGGSVMLLLDWGLLTMLQQAGIAPDPANEASIRQGLAQAPLLEMTSLGLMAPWMEERVVRGRLLGRFHHAGKPVVGLVLTSLLFALLHEFGPDSHQPLAEWLALIGVYAWSGVGFGLLYLWSGRLGAAIVAHAVNNLMHGGLVLLELA